MSIEYWNDDIFYERNIETIDRLSRLSYDKKTVSAISFSS